MLGQRVILVSTLNHVWIHSLWGNGHFFLSLKQEKSHLLNALNISPPLFIYLLTSYLSESLPNLLPGRSYLRDSLPLAQEFLELSSWLKCFPNKKFYIVVQVMKNIIESSSTFHLLITSKGYCIHCFSFK